MAKEKTVKFFITMNTFDKKEVEGTIRVFDECPDEQWGFRKISDCYWNVTHIRSGLEAVSGRSKGQCTKELKRLLSNPELVKQIKEHADIDETIKQHKKDFERACLRNKTFVKLRTEFKELTGITCPIDVIIGGLDIIKLDEMIKTPDNVSMDEHLRNLYGDRAAEIVNEMIEAI